MVFLVVSLLSCTCTGCPTPDNTWHFWQMQPETHLVFYLPIHCHGLIYVHPYHARPTLKWQAYSVCWIPIVLIIIWWEKWMDIAFSELPRRNLATDWFGHFVPSMLYVRGHSVATNHESRNFHNWLISILIPGYKNWTYKMFPVHANRRNIFWWQLPRHLWKRDSLDYSKIFQTPLSLFDATWYELFFTCLCTFSIFLGVVNPINFSDMKV